MRLTGRCRLLDGLQSQLDRSNAVLAVLFPGKDPVDLAAMTREDLISMALTLSPSGSPPQESADHDEATDLPVQRPDGVESLEALEEAPLQDVQREILPYRTGRVQGISDDINGLSLSVDNQSSYVGISSITAALKAVVRTAPVAKQYILHSYTETALPSRANSPRAPEHAHDVLALPSSEVGYTLAESYFSRVHPLMPMVDEDCFWNTYLYRTRSDGPWLGLMNMVFALGSLAASTCSNEEHLVYFHRARHHIDLEIYTGGNILIVQALGLLGGYYLHWLNRPNEANTVMGAAFRTATTLGLHREYSEASTQQHASSVPSELRRRTWWTLVLLDTWANMTTGRPSFGRISSAITVQPPALLEQWNITQNSASLKMLPLVHNIGFCRLATQVQDKLAARSLLRIDELAQLDDELVRWHERLPSILKIASSRSYTRPRSASIRSKQCRTETPSASTAEISDPFDFSRPVNGNDACPEVLQTPRAIMYWWYMTLRMLMHRPYLLSMALRRIPLSETSADEQDAVKRCRLIAGDTIHDVPASCREELISGWAAVWLMYQAVMVPIVSLFAIASLASRQSPEGQTVDGRGVMNAESEAEIHTWTLQVETAIAFFDRMQRFSIAAKKTRDVVQRLLNASKHVRQHYEAAGQRQQVQEARQTDGVQHTQPLATNTADATHGDVVMDAVWDDMLWDTFPGASSFGLDAAFPDDSGIDWSTFNDVTLGGQWIDWAGQQ